MKMKNLIIVDDRRDMRNSLIALANAKGQPKNNIFTAASIGEFRGLANKEGNEFVRNSSIILDVNLPDGKSSQIVREFKLEGNFAIFSAMRDDYFKEFKSILEGSALYKGRVFPKSDPYGVLVSLGIGAKDEKALEGVQSVSTSIGVAVHSPPHFAIEHIVPNLLKMLQHVSNIGKNKTVVNIVLNRGMKSDALMKSLDAAFRYTSKVKVDFIQQADFLDADLNMVLCFPKDISGFPKAYQSVLSHAMHQEGHKTHDIGELAESYL